MSTIELVASVVASRLGPMLAKVGPGGLRQSMAFKREAKGDRCCSCYYGF